MATLDTTYWNNRYEEKQTGWDIGYANPFLVEYVKRYPKPTQILFPGAGNAYEVAELYNQGYTNIVALDVAPNVRKQFLERNPQFPESQYIIADFFEFSQQFDLIVEQTFFCALDPKLRKDYVFKMNTLLKRGGRLAGLLFTFDKPDGPPFGGSAEEYKELFALSFDIKHLEECNDSIPERMGNEVFFEVRKR